MNEYFEKCWNLAAKSPCTKMKFGSVVVLNGVIVSEGYNKPAHDCIEYLCHPCIREGIKSGTQLEKCVASHAEMVAIFNALVNLPDLSDATLYVAGLFPDGNRFIKNEKSFYCSLCSRVMSEANLNDLRVPVKDENGNLIEGKLTREEYLKSSYEFATEKKEVKSFF